jgi:CheY-like chemotaxis protein
VVDDDVLVRDVFVEYLQLWGYRAVAAADGVQGLALARQLSPHLIILDIAMPDVDGWEVLERLKTDASMRHIPVLVYSMLDEPERAVRSGAVDYCPKPTPPGDLRETVEKALALGVATVFVVDAEPALAERLEDDLSGLRCAVRPVRDIAEARAIRPMTPAVVLLPKDAFGGSGEELLRAWRTDSSFRDSVVILIGDWLPAVASSDGTASTLQVAPACGRRVSDIAGQVRTIVAGWGRPSHG